MTTLPIAPHLSLTSSGLALAMAALLAGCAQPGPTVPATTAASATSTAASPAGASPGAAAPAAVARPVAAAASAVVRATPTAARPPSASASAAASTASALAGRGPAGAAAPGSPPPPPPFADVIKEAKRADGWIPVWTKDDKVWFEITPERLDQPFFFSASLANGLGDGRFWPGLMSTGRVVTLRKVGNQLQLLSRNLMVRAPDNTPLARAVSESYSDSLMASAALASAAHPERKSYLVDAYALLGGDITSAQAQLESSYRLSYTLDRANSVITRSATSAQGATITVRSHYSVARIPTMSVPGPGGTPPNPATMPSPPGALPDARSLFLGHTYTLAPLPATPMRARAADPRVGYFATGFMDYAKDTGADRRTHLIHRWRLEKKDPAAAVSEPRQPIRVVMDRNIPDKWRPAVRAGILEWNKAFERAGFRNAIALEQQAADTDWTTLEGTRLLAVRWFAQEGSGATAVGPSQADPRTGELLRGAAIIPEGWSRLFRNRVLDTQPRLQPLEGHEAHRHGAEDGAVCNHAQEALDQAAMGLELMTERGLIDPGSPEAERFIADSLKDVTMHEVGHALGLRHNFKASTGVTRAQLRDAAFTRERGISNSVMDYNGMNTALDNEPQNEMFMTTLGAYDYWAIEYGYREFTPEEEARGLAEIAARSERDANLAYATDEDVYGNDPQVNQRDLGDDPLAYAQRQMAIARELWTRTTSRALSATDDMTLYRRNLQRVLGSFSSTVPLVAKHVGGAYTERVLAGANRPLIAPVPAERQRQALDFVVTEVFSSQSFRFDPKIMSRLGIDQNERFSSRGVASVDFSLGQSVLGIQRQALDALMSDSLAARLADAEVKVTDPRGLLNYADVQNRLTQAVWSELRAKSGAREIDTLRRNLQREHLRRLAGGLLRPASTASADVPAVHRQQARQLEAELKAALAQGGWNAIARAHLEDSLHTLSETLKAPLARQGV